MFLKETATQFVELGLLKEAGNPVVDFAKQLQRTRKGETIRIVAGELDGPEWFHVLSLRELILAKERGVVIKIVAGPVILAEPTVKATIEGDERALKKLRRWLSPLTKHNLMETQWVENNGNKSLEVTGYERTVKSLCELMDGEQQTSILPPAE